MISQNQIIRHIEAQEFSLLVDRILGNGRCRSQSAQRVLRDPAIAAAAGIGLALQRLAELTYRPTPMADGLVQLLMALQRFDGSFAGPTSRTLNLAATSTALRGLLTWREQRAAAAIGADFDVDAAIERGLNFLQAAFGEHAHMEDAALGWAIVLWQLGDIEAFRSRVPTDEL